MTLSWHRVELFRIRLLEAVDHIVVISLVTVCRLVEATAQGRATSLRKVGLQQRADHRQAHPWQMQQLRSRTSTKRSYLVVII